MKLQKPSWINHDGHPIFSVDIHPSSHRFATGGQGADSMGRIVIWGMGFIEHLDDRHPIEMARFLCQLDHHSACVNCVRWSNKGKYLASGGDDKIIMIWEMKGYPAVNSVTTNQNSCFGKSAQETWKPIFTLRSHTGDILDLAWSPDDRYLASASVDNKVLIWDALKFPRIVKEIQGHTSLVKGVTWDPVGNYLATQSDDQSLKIWRTSDWMMEHNVTDSFAECGGTTHVLRLDWSPDGGYLVSAHAMNCGGPTAQIVERDGWKTDKDFVGHRKAIVCVRFTRTMLQKGKSQMCYVALGSRDRTLSIWSTALKRPLVVIRDAFTNSVMDLAWSSDGKIMMACSADGTVAVATFSKKEIGDPLSQEEMISLHQRVYGKKLNYLSTSSDHLIQSVEVFMARKKAERIAAAEKSILNSSNGNLPEHPELESKEPVDIVIRGPTDKQIETRTADGKRRITPKFLLPHNDVTSPAFQTSEEVVFGETRAVNTTTSVSLRRNMVSEIDEVRTFKETVIPSNVSSSPPSILKTDCGNDRQGRAVESGGNLKKRIIPVRIDNPGTNGTQQIEPVVVPHMNGTTSNMSCNGDISTNKVIEKTDKLGLENCQSGSEDKMRSAMKRRRDSDELQSFVPPKKLIKACVPINREQNKKIITGNTATKAPLPSSTVTLDGKASLLTPLKIESSLITKVCSKVNSIYQLQVSNSVNGINWLKCQHSPSSFEGLQWAVSTDAPICGVVGDTSRIAAACEDSTVHILDLKGRYVLPPYLISSLPSKLCLSDVYLLIITVNATVHVWNIHLNKSIIKCESILPLLRPNNAETIYVYQATVLSSGAPLVALSNGKRFLFNFDMQTWVFITNAILLTPSLGNVRKPLDGFQTDSLLMDATRVTKKETSITDIKLRLASAIELLKVPDVQTTLVVLAKALATKGCRQELHILCEDLLGPTHSSSTASQSWDPQFAGVDKRKVLREILNVLLTDLKWQDFFMEFDELLQLVESNNSRKDEPLETKPVVVIP